MKVAAYIRVSGVVQGVGYRYFTQRTAIKLALSGYVKNRYDGDVEMEVEGEKDLIEKFIETLKIGPPAAHVRDIQVQWKEKSSHEYDGFQVTF